MVVCTRSRIRIGAEATLTIKRLIENLVVHKPSPCPSNFIGQKPFWTGQNYIGPVKIVRS